MRLYEFVSPIKTYIARVKLKNGSTFIATERTESLSYARQIFQHKFGDKNVFSVTEVKDRVIDEGTMTQLINTSCVSTKSSALSRSS